MTYGYNITSYECQWYDIYDKTWKTDGCILLNVTINNIICGCQHLTTFRGIGNVFIPQINILTMQHFNDITLQNIFIKYPTPLIAVCIVLLFCYILICLLKHFDDTPLLARIEVFENKTQRISAMKKWRVNRETRVLQNLKINDFKKLYLIFKMRLKDDHIVLSLFQRSEGTNFSTLQRIHCLMLYLFCLMASAALFYGQTPDGM